jgi:hypothetical protein
MADGKLESDLLDGVVIMDDSTRQKRPEGSGDSGD